MYAEGFLGMRASNGRARAAIDERPVRRRVGDADAVLGRRIRRIRVERKLTQEELAERLGISCQQLQKYESGINRVSAVRLVDLARVLNVGVAALATDVQGEQSSAPDRSVAPTVREVTELLEAFYAVRSAEARAKVLEMTRLLSRLGD